jgi:hypothetical protein
MEQTDIWSINPSTSATFFRTATTVTGGVFPRALILNNTNPVVAKEGAGYKIIIDSSLDDSGITFTINGAIVGDLTNQVPGPAPTAVPEVLTGGSSTSVTSTYYYSSIDSITISGAAAGTVAVGTTGDLALPRCRIKGFYVLCAAGAGSLKVNRWSWATGAAVDKGTILDITTPGGATLTQFLSLPGQGILTGQQINDYSVVVLTTSTDYTLFCG